MWPVLRHEEILRLQQPKSATSTISTNREESRTMRSAETQTELLECESSSSCGEAPEVDGDRGSSDGGVGSGMEGEDEKVELEVEEEELEDDEEEDSLGEESKLKSIKRLGCSNLFNFNKLELLNERCSGGPQQQQISDSSRNLCEHEVHVAIDDDLTTTGEGKRTTMAMRTAVLGGGGDDSGSCSSIIFIQESPEVIL